MLNRIILANVILTLCVAIGVFQFKHRVVALEQNLHSIERALYKLDENKQILTAEWSFLNRPEHLMQLAETHLTLEEPNVVKLVSHKRYAQMAQIQEKLTVVRLARFKARS